MVFESKTKPFHTTLHIIFFFFTPYLNNPLSGLGHVATSKFLLRFIDLPNFIRFETCTQTNNRNIYSEMNLYKAKSPNLPLRTFRFAHSINNAVSLLYLTTLTY